MNYPSCIKMPISKCDNSPDSDNILSSLTSDKSSSITYDDLMMIADDVFGVGKWSHAVTSQTVDFVEYVMGKYHIGCVAFVRVELPDKTYHEEMGYCNAESSVKGHAIYSARSSSITSALKKALLSFGGIIDEKIKKHTLNNNKPKRIKLVNDEHESDDIIKNSRTNSILKRPKSPNTTDQQQVESLKLCNKNTTNECIIKNDTSESKTISTLKPMTSFNSTNPPPQQQQQQQQQQITNINTKNVDNVSATRTMTEDELRNERKRKQREKQEEYRRLMMKES